MRNLVTAIALTAAVAIGGALAWQAQAATSAGAIPLASTPVTQSIQPAACRHPGPHCRWGHHLRCGPYGHHCWCAPC